MLKRMSAPLMALAGLLMVAPVPKAQAGVRFGVRWGTPVYVAPAPVYPPAYVAPAPDYAAPYPGYAYPAPVYTAPAYVYPFVTFGWHGQGYRRHWGHHDDHRFGGHGFGRGHDRR